MSADSRDRVTVDLRGLAPAVKAHASARNMTLAAFARAAMVEALRQAKADPFHLWPGVRLGRRPEPVKLTLSLPLRQASWLVEHARAAGLSYGTYLASVIDGTPAPGGLGEAVRALTASTDQLAALSTDLNDFVRLLRQGRSRRSREVPPDESSSLFDEVRQHMRLDAALSAEVRAAIRWRAARAESVLRKESRHERAFNRRCRPGRVGRAPVLSGEPDRRGQRARRASPPSPSAIAPLPCAPVWKRPCCGARRR